MGNTLSLYSKAFLYTNFNGNTRRKMLNVSIHKTRRNISPQRIISQWYPSVRLTLVVSCLNFPCVQHLVKYSLIWPKISEKIYHFTSWNTVKDYDLQDAIDKNSVSLTVTFESPHTSCIWTGKKKSQYQWESTFNFCCELSKWEGWRNNWAKAYNCHASETMRGFYISSQEE